MVVFFDIDGTIIDNRTQSIPESAVRAVEALCRKGHIPVINTGRPYSHIDPRIRQMAFRGWVCGCGMEVQLDGQWLQQLYPDLAARQFAVRCSRQHRMETFYETADGGLLLDGEYTHPWIRSEVAAMRQKGFGIRELEDTENPEFLKLVTFRVPRSNDAAFLAEMADYFTIIDRGDDMFELILPNCSKAAGMQLVLDHLGLSREEALAIGDSANDLPMFALAGHTVCMGNGMDIAKANAEYITDTVLNDGIEKALRHYGLID